MKLLKEDFLISKYINFSISSLLTIVTVLVLIPLKTYKLEVEDFAIVAILNSLIGIIVAVSSFGSPYLLFIYSKEKNKKKLGKILFTLHLSGSIISSLIGIMAIVIIYFLYNKFSILSSIPILFYFITFVDLIFTSFLFLVSGMAKLGFGSFGFMIIGLSKCISNVILISIMLYYLDLGLISLLYSQLLSSIISFFLYFYFYGKNFHYSIDWKVFKENLGYGLFTSPSLLLERFKNFYESLLISSKINLESYALYNHAFSYQNIILSLTNPITNASASNLRDKLIKKKYNEVKLVNEVINILIVYSIIFFIWIGPDLISLLTFDKFTKSNEYLVYILIITLVSVSGRSQFLLMQIEKKGKRVSVYQSVSYLFLIFSLPILLMFYGILGAIISYLIQVLIFRLAFEYERLKSGGKFCDQSLFLCFFIVGTSFAIEKITTYQLESKILILTSLSLLIFFSKIKRFREFKLFIFDQ